MAEPIRNIAYSFTVALEPWGGGNTFVNNPTLAAGDVKVSVDGGTPGNITTLPSVTPAGGKQVLVQLSAAEMNAAAGVAVLFSDQAGSEWKDLRITIPVYSYRASFRNGPAFAMA